MTKLGTLTVRYHRTLSGLECGTTAMTTMVVVAVLVVIGVNDKVGGRSDDVDGCGGGVGGDRSK